MTRYRNHYTCPNCQTEWYDDSEHTQNDRCPQCDTETEPDETTDIPEDKN